MAAEKGSPSFSDGLSRKVLSSLRALNEDLSEIEGTVAGVEGNLLEGLETSLQRRRASQAQGNEGGPLLGRSYPLCLPGRLAALNHDGGASRPLA